MGSAVSTNLPDGCSINDPRAPWNAEEREAAVDVCEHCGKWAAAGWQYEGVSEFHAENECECCMGALCSACAAPCPKCGEAVCTEAEIRCGCEERSGT